MSVVNLWKPQKLQSRMRLTEPGCEWRFVRIAENRAPTGESVGKFRIWSTPSTYFPHLSQALSTGYGHVIASKSLERAETTCTTFAESVQHRGEAACASEWREGKVSGLLQCVHQRVIVRFRSLSDRRNSSILLIECSTVVWCLPPNLAADLRK